MKFVFFIFYQIFLMKMIVQSRFTESSTNLEYVFIDDYNDYHLYQLIYQYNSTFLHVLTINQYLEKYLQISFATPDRPYANILQLCGSNILAFFARNTTPSIENIHGLLLARLDAYDNSKYICYVSVLQEHRQKGLGTKLLHEAIIGAIREKNFRIALHVNTENNNALSLYARCGMRCFGVVPNYYSGDQTYATQNAFLMILELKNIRDSSAVCQNSTAVEISQEEESVSKQKCSSKTNDS